MKALSFLLYLTMRIIKVPFWNVAIPPFNQWLKSEPSMFRDLWLFIFLAFGSVLIYLFGWIGLIIFVIFATALTMLYVNGKDVPKEVSEDRKMRKTVYPE